MSAISREKALRLFGGFEAPHLLFTQARGLVRIFRTIIQPFMLTVLHTRQDFAFRRAITLQLISDDYARYVLQPFEKRGANKRFATFAVRVGSAPECPGHCRPGPRLATGNVSRHGS